LVYKEKTAKYSWRILYSICTFIYCLRILHARRNTIGVFRTIHVYHNPPILYMHLGKIFMVYSRNSINNFDAIYKHA
jgi:hypothetical protein